MASRSGKGGFSVPDKVEPKGSSASVSVNRPEEPERDDRNELILHVKVGYKTILLVVIIFDLVHLSVREIVNVNFLERLFG